MINRELCVVFIALLLAGCSIRHMAVNAVADSFASSSTVYAADDDMELVGDAIPFGLKTMESLLESTPKHQGLLLSLTKGFTQYTYAYVQLPADEIEENDIKAAYEKRERAQKLYLRARDYGLRGLAVDIPEISTKLRKDPDSVLARATVKHVPLLYWTAAAWASAISIGKDNPYLLADLPAVGALIKRALELDESYDYGALHVFYISYVMSRSALIKNAAVIAQQHFKRAVELSNGFQAAPYIALAEAVYVPEQNRSKFTQLLKQALSIDVDKKVEWRLANLIMQRRARLLLSKSDQLFAD